MATSQAQIDANRRNASLSTGPKTSEGKVATRANSFKHGMTGAGVVLPNEDAAEVEKRLVGFRIELQPIGEVSESLVRRAAVLSVRLDRSVSQETASLAGRVRQAEADFVAPAGLNNAEVDQLRSEAKCRAMFDPSAEAALARKYEAATERGMFRALKELRELQRQAKVAEPRANPDEFSEILASFSQVQKECETFQSHSKPNGRQTPTPPPRRHESAPIADVGTVFDVPFTIGRPR